MIKLILSAAVVLFLLSSPAWADSEAWIAGCDDAATADDHELAAVTVTSALIAGERACTTSATSTNETLVLDVSACDHIDVFQFVDADGDGTSSLVIGQIQFCPNSFDDDDSCDDFEVTVFAAADEIRAGLSASFVRIASAGTSDADLVRWEIRCVGQAGH